MQAPEFIRTVLQFLSSSEFWTAGSTLVIAAFTAALFVLQRKQHKHDIEVADANYRLALHDKRLEVLSAVEEFVADFYRSGDPSLDKAAEMMFRLRDADLLFPKDALEPIKEFKRQAGRYYVLKSRVDHLRGIIATEVYDGTESEEARAERRDKEVEEAYREVSEKLDKMHDIQRWVVDRTDGQRENIEWLKPLREYMELPPTLKPGKSPLTRWAERVGPV